MKKLFILFCLSVSLVVSGCAGHRTDSKKGRIEEQSAKTKAAMSAYTSKATPVANDTFLISDSEAANATKKVSLGSAPISTATQTALDGKANASAFASQAAFTAAWGWTPGGGTFDQAGNYTLTGSWDFTGATVTGISGGSMVYPSATGVVVYGGSSAWGDSLAVGTAIGNLVALVDDGSGNAALPFSLDISDLTDTEGLLGSGLSAPTAGIVTSNGTTLSSITPGAGVTTALSAAVDGTGGLASKAALDAVSVGSPITSAPTYSDSTCTAGQYAFGTTPPQYWCKATNTWDYQVVSGDSLVWANWSNPTPDTTPAAFSFVDQTDVDTSTEITSALVQITGINSATAVTASGGTAAICTSSDIGDCGTFGTSPGNITNNQYIAARHTSSSIAETEVNTVVTVGGVSDTFTSTTAAAIANGSVGTTSYTTSAINQPTAQYITFDAFTATAGQVQYAHIRTLAAYTGTAIIARLYNSSYAEIAACSATGSSGAGWITCQSSPVTLTAVSYYVGHNGSSGIAESTNIDSGVYNTEYASGYQSVPGISPIARTSTLYGNGVGTIIWNNSATPPN